MYLVEADIFQEAYSNRIELEDDDPATVERMISYIYTFDYKDEQHQDRESNSCSSVSPGEDVEITIGENEDMSDHDGVQPALASSVRVYAIADKYGMPSLKELAKERFCNWAEGNWTHEDFSDIVREIFQSTPNSDRGLRDVVVRIVATHVDNLTQKDEFRHLLEEIGDLGLGVLCQVLTTHSKEVSDLGLQIRRLEAETEMLKRQLQECEQNLSRQAKDISSTMSRINNLVECRYCSEGFNVEAEGYLYGGVAARCKRCRTKHYPG